MATGRASPRDLSFLGRTLRCLPALKAKLTARKSRLLNQLEAEIDLCVDLRGKLDAALVDDCPLASREGGFIRDGFNAELDELRELARGGKQWIAQYQAERDRADRHPQPEGRLQQGLRLLHRGHQRPPRQGARRLHPQADAQERRALHHAGAEGVRGEGAHGRREGQGPGVRAVRRASRRGGRRAGGGCRPRPPCWPSSTCWSALAELARERNYCRPRWSTSRCCDIVDGRHPVLDILEPDGTFVPNDTHGRRRRRARSC